MVAENTSPFIRYVKVDVVLSVKFVKVIINVRTVTRRNYETNKSYKLHSYGVQ